MTRPAYCRRLFQQQLKSPLTASYGLPPCSRSRSWSIPVGIMRMRTSFITTNSAHRALLDRGHYAVIGPREVTTLGLTSDITSDPNYIKSPIGTPSKQNISLKVSQAFPTNLPRVTDINGVADPNIDSSGNTIKLPLGIVAAGGGPGTGWPQGWTANSPAAANGIGVSISEPLFSSPSYYKEPMLKGPDGITEWYGDWQMTDPAKGYFLDTPIETPNPLYAQDQIAPAKHERKPAVYRHSN